MTETLPGYRALGQLEMHAIDDIKIMEERLLRYLEALPGLNFPVDQRWLAIGRTHLQEASMAIVRAIAQPTRIDLPEDDE